MPDHYTVLIITGAAIIIWWGIRCFHDRVEQKLDQIIGWFINLPKEFVTRKEFRQEADELWHDLSTHGHSELNQKDKVIR